MPCEKYFMILNAFGAMQCLLCSKSFKDNNEYILKRHFVNFHKTITYLDEKERKCLFKEKRDIFLQKISDWLRKNECLDYSESINENLKTQLSSSISVEIVRQGRPFSDGVFIKKMCSQILQKLSYNQTFIDKLPLSPRSVARRTDQIGARIEFKIKEEIENCKYFSICLDESTDLNDLSQLALCVRCVNTNYDIFVTLYSLESFDSNVTGKLLFEVVNEKLFSVVDMTKFAGVCTDGANVMIGNYDGFIGQLKKHGINVHNFHCIIHQVALCSKFISTNPVMKISEKIINRIRGGHNSLTHRKFVKFLKNKSAEYSDLKMFTEVRWLSRGECLNRLFLQFLEVEGLEKSAVGFLKDTKFIFNLAFITDISLILNELNKQLQGCEKNIHDVVKLLCHFKTKLFLLIAEIKEGNYANFPRTALIFSKIKYINQCDHIVILETLFNNFEGRFKDFEKIQPLLDLFENPFHCDISRYEFYLQSELIILRSDREVSNKSSIIEFWQNLDDSFYPELKKMHLNVYHFFPLLIYVNKFFQI
ncbi:zinc finger MYM-type protein 6-like [Bactrocera dorsalis]|uniref:Zinc finger MYM-type protein 6-like n=1 Tax=Bactrocera dorsalis TaxID=27457 RepID=A0ABM3K4T0_BACDO|nr:zinc finger MYM-type protein 6-like [Bactrocera dorsalis]